ncbi:MAG: ATP-binding protein, partial [Chloroflexota bacterium]
QIAEKNAKRHEVLDRLNLQISDIFTTLKNEQFDLIVSNPPYIPQTDFEILQAEVREFEPTLALTDGKNGLSTIEKIVNDLSDMAQEKQVSIATSLQNPLPTVMGDQSRLELTVRNLLHNAILYSQPETTIAVHSWGDSNELYFSVADRGIGIADEEIELIFDRLYRSKDERIRELPGGGLGLTVAKTIVKRHGGDIWASSNLNVGSTFTFVLPVVKKDN